MPEMKITAGFTEEGQCVYAHRGIIPHHEAIERAGPKKAALLQFRDVTFEEAMAAASPGFKTSLRMLRTAMRRAADMDAVLESLASK